MKSAKNLLKNKSAMQRLRNERIARNALTLKTNKSRVGARPVAKLMTFNNKQKKAVRRRKKRIAAEKQTFQQQQYFQKVDSRVQTFSCHSVRRERFTQPAIPWVSRRAR